MIFQVENGTWDLVYCQERNVPKGILKVGLTQLTTIFGIAQKRLMLP